MSPQDHPTDPALAATNATTSRGTRTDSLYDALTDPELAPTLDAAPPRRHVESFLVLAVLLGGALGGAWYLGTPVLQSVPALVAAAAAVLAAMWFTGTLWVDWWELVLGYWWLSLPVGGAAAVAFVLMQEDATGVREVD